MKNTVEFQLEHYVGPQRYYPHQRENAILFLTDGCKYVAEKAQADWLFDILLSYQQDPRIREEALQVWTLESQPGGGWLISCTDGYETVLLTHYLTYSDFPLRRIEVYLLDSVCLLASEYEKPSLDFSFGGCFLGQ